MNLSQQIKAKFKTHGVKCRTSKYGQTITVTILSACTRLQRDEVQALETIELHGDIMNDTRWCSGVRIQFKYAWEPTAEETTQAQALYLSWLNPERLYSHLDAYHFRNQLLSELGLIGHLLADRLIFKNPSLKVA